MAAEAAEAAAVSYEDLALIEDEFEEVDSEISKFCSFTSFRASDS